MDIHSPLSGLYTPVEVQLLSAIEAGGTHELDPGKTLGAKLPNLHSITDVDMLGWLQLRAMSGEEFTAFIMRVQAHSRGQRRSWLICRRYSDFRALFLLLRPLGLPLGSFPGRSLRTSEDFLGKRCAGLGTWIQRVVAAIGPIAGQASALEPFFLEQRDVLPGEVLKASGAAVHLATAALQVQNNVSIGKLMLKLRDEADDTAASPDGGPGTGHGVEPAFTPAAQPAAAPEDTTPEAQPTSQVPIPVSSSSDTPLAVAQAAGIGRVSAVAAGAPAAAAAASGRLAVSPTALLPGSKATSSNPLNAFALLRVLGQGSFAKVLQVRHKSTGALYAMKILSKPNVVKRKQVEHTKTERAVLETTASPFVVRLHAAFQSKSKLFLVLDYCPGGELFFHMQKRGIFEERAVQFYTAQLVLALEHLHSCGIVYRDLKPENILLDAAGNIKLGDFGLSKQGITAPTGATASFCGTPEYIAPEMLRRSGHGTAVDWWSLGMLVYELLTGLPPWYSRDRKKLYQRIQSAELAFPDDMSPAAQSFIASLLVRDPAARLGGDGQVSAIKEHPFFHGMDWAALQAGELPAPIRIRLRQDDDPKYFDKTFTSMEPSTCMREKDAVRDKRAPDEVHESPSNQFDGFTFTPAGFLAAGSGSPGSFRVGSLSTRASSPRASGHSHRCSVSSQLRDVSTNSGAMPALNATSSPSNGSAKRAVLAQGLHPSSSHDTPNRPTPSPHEELMFPLETSAFVSPITC